MRNVNLFSTPYIYFVMDNNFMKSKMYMVSLRTWRQTIEILFGQLKKQFNRTYVQMFIPCFRRVTVGCFHSIEVLYHWKMFHCHWSGVSIIDFTWIMLYFISSSLTSEINFPNIIMDFVFISHFSDYSKWKHLSNFYFTASFRLSSLASLNINITLR